METKICPKYKSFGHNVTTCPSLKHVEGRSNENCGTKMKQEWLKVNRGAALVNRGEARVVEGSIFSSSRGATASHDISLWHSKIKNIDGIPIVEVRKMLIDLKLSLVCLVETWVRIINKPSVIKSFLKNGTCLTTTIVIALEGFGLVGTQEFLKISFVYGSNDDRARRALWENMCANLSAGTPWIVLGNFNVARGAHDTIGSSSRQSAIMDEFEDCLQAAELDHLRFSGFFHTWCNKRSNYDCISKKSDRVVINDAWLAKEALEECQRLFDAHHTDNTLRLGVTNEEIRDICFSLHPNKASGLDGFNAHFFKKTWGIVVGDIINTVQEFFRTGHRLKELNTTILALVPKVPNPSRMMDFRPISCCNTLYKIIAKIIANRIKIILPNIISPPQSAFVARRRIGENILLVQELMRNYNKDDGAPKCSLKVDLMKAFDTVEWDFLLETLAAFPVPSKVINWIKACITTPKFSISINGELAGFFHSKRGLCQGDPMSPYLFVIAMEVLTKLLAKHIQDSTHYKYHWKCDKIKFSHLCFADDLIMLCHGSTPSATILKMSLDNFSSLSGLKANPAKSNIFLSSVPNDIRQQLINIFGYNVGSFPISLLCLLSKVQRNIEQKLCSFLWKGVDGNCQEAKVAWSDICLPKNEGGLGIKDLISWNKVLMI
ncbi:hypothetical protein Dsin_012443 [Dipteronia sinensis]|uniref:Reverse transcriptase domain-containing protein n=1 Tax=Dipteronia sinensis TaxID=43782 RepID=A0AAE0AI01_9ROSI|nr:hypothetical protein Dsin_012443 [Dipteronia sinensis]